MTKGAVELELQKMMAQQKCINWGFASYLQDSDIYNVVLK